MVKINAAIWHLAPLPVNQEQLTAMIILPECTYANDCTVVDLPEEQQFQIVL
jgi:ureidoglycolate lyase